MSLYALLDISKTVVIDYPMTIYQLRAGFDNISWPETPTPAQLDLYNMVIVEEVEMPNPSQNNKVIVEITPQKINGVWTQVFEEIFMTGDNFQTLKDEQLALLAETRYDQEIAGITWSGHLIHTDREAQMKMYALYTMARDGYWETGYWKCKDETFVLLDAPAAMEMALTVGNHVKTCYDREQTLANQINAATTVAELEWHWTV
jgi:hypothetical protein